MCWIIAHSGVINYVKSRIGADSFLLESLESQLISGQYMFSQEETQNFRHDARGDS